MSTEATDISEAREALTCCPFCRYDLQGLPRNYRCPECGFEYNESMQAWGHRRSLLRANVSYLIAIGVLLALLAFSVFVSFVTQTSYNAFAPIILWGTFLIITLRKGPRHQIVIASKEGIILSNWGKVKRLPWHTFWVPNPGNPRELPPWAEQWNEKLITKGRLVYSLFRARPLLHTRSSSLYKPVSDKWLWVGGAFVKYVSLQNVGPRKTRKAMMRELRRRWEKANAQLIDEHFQRAISDDEEAAQKAAQQAHALGRMDTLNSKSNEA